MVSKTIVKEIQRIAILTVSFVFLTPVHAETVKCKKDDPHLHSGTSSVTTVNVALKRNIGIPYIDTESLSAAVKSEPYHLNFETQVRRSKRGEFLFYKDFLLEGSLVLAIKSKVVAGDNLEGTLTLDQGRWYEQKISGLSCSISGAPVPPVFPCPETKEKANLALIAAAKSGTAESLRDLLECGANVNFRDTKGCTALSYVTDLGCGYSSDPTQKDPSDPDASEAPILSSRSSLTLKDLIRVLVEYDANIETRDRVNGQTPLMKLVKYGHFSEAEFLLESSANVDAQDNEGMTSLMLAATQGNGLMLQTLLFAKPDLSLKNKKGKTAYDIALDHGHTHLLELLKPSLERVTIEGIASGGCKPTMVHLTQGKLAEIVLKATASDMFLLTAPDLGLELMAMPNEEAKQTITPERTGTFPFQCGVHGAPDDKHTKGSFMVM